MSQKHEITGIGSSLSEALRNCAQVLDERIGGKAIWLDDLRAWSDTGRVHVQVTVRVVPAQGGVS